MDRDVFKGLKISFGFFLGCFILFGLVFAVGFHTANEIIGGTFSGKYTFNGSINVTGSSYGTVPSGLIFQSNSSNCPGSFVESLGAQALIPQDQGDLIGNITIYGGLAGLFDTDITQTNGEASYIGSKF
jgi:hypothetical protein